MQSEKWNLNRLDLWAEVALNLLNEAGAVFKGDDSYLAPRAEAALSAAEPARWMWEERRFAESDIWDDMYDNEPPAPHKYVRNVRPLYVAPPAPSVAVKAEIHEVIDYLYKHGELTYGRAAKAVHLLTNNGFGFTKNSGSAALSAQVQDAAGNATICVGEQTIARLRNGLSVEFDNGLALIPSSDLEDEDIGPHEKALRDAVEPFLDWLEQREEGAHIAEVREGLIGVEDVIPDDHVVLGAHLRAQKDQGVLTIGHFRRLQAAYDGKISDLPAAPAKQEGGESQPVHKPAVDSGESGDE